MIFEQRTDYTKSTPVAGRRSTGLERKYSKSCRQFTPRSRKFNKKARCQVDIIIYVSKLAGAYCMQISSKPPSSILRQIPPLCAFVAFSHVILLSWISTDYFRTRLYFAVSLRLGFPLKNNDF